MSAITNLKPTPIQAPEHAAPAPVVPPHRPGFRKWLILLAVVVIGGVAARQFLQSPPQPAAPTGPVAIRTAKVAQGTLQNTVRLSGQTSAREFATIIAPVMRGPDSGRALILIELAKSGSAVKKGDLLAQIDAQSLQDHVDDVHSTVLEADADIKKRQAEQMIDWEYLSQTARMAKAELDKMKLEAAASEIRTPIDQELLKLSVEEANAYHKQLQAEFGFKKTGQEAEIKILGYTRERHVRHRDRHRVDVTKFTVRSPIDGLVVMQSMFRGGEMAQIQQGDQVAPGQPFLKVVNPSNMQVEASINQAESSQFRIGQRVRIGLDAFPGLELKGRIYSIGALASGGWRQNYFIRNIPVRIEVLDSDPRMIPDLSASADVVIESEENVKILPLEAVHKEKDSQVVFVKKGERFEKREVALGLRNATHAAVVSGLEPGEEIALSLPLAVN